MTLPAGTRLGPYEILSPIGAGGMGEVYRARDKKLDRDVAIKVLPESVATHPDRLARFEREAKAVAALSHPNILAIHDFGTHEGISYAVMELLEGETLRERLDGGPIPQKQAVDYALQVTKGLSAAHKKGVVHRDLKPENLFVMKDGHLKILDFGLAKREAPVAPGEETSAPTVSGHTEPGTVMGTVGYMSPEQVRGLPVDHRSDIFSFGAILYELLSGKRAFQRATSADTMAAILNEEPPELTGSGGDISVALDHVVRHCLEKDRNDRFQTARDVAFNLSEQSSPVVTSRAQLAAPPARKRRGLIAAALLVILAVAGGVVLRESHKGVGAVGGVKRVAVLPFENLGAPEDDYFADGIADEIRGKLTTLASVQVIARASSTPYKKTSKTPKQIAQELDVGYLLTATVRWEKSGGTSRVHVSPELVEVSGSAAPTSKWQQPFDAALTDVFQVQSEIATKVAHALGVVLGRGEEWRMEEKPTQNLAAYDAFLRGEEAGAGLSVIDPASLTQAIAFYERAVALDPSFAQAWAQLSRASSLLHRFGASTNAIAERARGAAERAVALAPNRPEGRVATGDYQRWVLAESTRALEEYTKAQRLAPGDVSTMTGIALAEETLGRWDTAVEHFRQAERLDPRSVASTRWLSDALTHLRRYSEAREAADRGLALAPGNLALLQWKAMTFLGEGNLAGARGVLRAAPKEVDPTVLVAYIAVHRGLAWVLDAEQLDLLLHLPPRAFDGYDRGARDSVLADGYALKGDAANVRSRAEEARKTIEEQLRGAPEDAGNHVALGLALAYLGRKEEAIREGERAVALTPVSRNAHFGPYAQHQLVRIYILVGEPEKAIDKLEPLLKIPYYVSPGWLKIDPTFDPLRGNPRFQKIVAGGE